MFTPKLPDWASGTLAAVLGLVIALLYADPVTAMVVRHELAEALVELAAVFGIGVPIVRGRIRAARKDGARFGEAATYAKALAASPPEASVPAKPRGRVRKP